MKQVNITLYYESLQEAAEAGFPDAVEGEDGYMALATFECSDYELEVDDEGFFVEISV